MTLTVRNEQPLSTTLTIASDDPDEPLVQAKALANQGGLGVGDEAPPLRGVDLQGRVWDLAELRGKVVVLAYFATF